MTACMNVKLATLHGNLVLGDQIYGLEALNPPRKNWMGLVYGGLDELFIQLGELGRAPPTFYVIKPTHWV